MNVHLYPTLEQVDREALHDATVIVIDVLRASSTIIAGIENGAHRIIPVEDIETASRLVGPGDRKEKLLAGERKGRPIEGFDLFNSPLEFTPATVAAKTVILTTSNGTRAILAASKARRVIICAINNVTAVAGAVGAEDEIVILCSGNDGALAIEDLLCGGMLIDRLGDRVSEHVLGDAERLALVLAHRFGDEPLHLLRMSDRGRSLIEDGYEADILYCSFADNTVRVPEVSQGEITS